LTKAADEEEEEGGQDWDLIQRTQDLLTIVFCEHYSISLDRALKLATMAQLGATKKAVAELDGKSKFRSASV
jgi:hypothetical protein